MEELQLRVEDFTRARKVMQEHNSDPVRAFELIQDELGEAGEVILAIAAIGINEELRKKLATELVDVGWMVLNMCNQMGIDFEAEFKEKEARNICKRPVSEWQEGTYADCDRKARREWTTLREAEFYQIPD